MFDRFVTPTIRGMIPHAGNANGAFAVEANGIRLVFVGGPFRHADTHGSNVWKLKMAKEQPGHADYVVALRDFTAPTPKQLLDAADRAIAAALTGKTVYVGCAGGIGRTGTMMAAILKVFDPTAHPVKLVREAYLSYAVETKEQEQVLYDIDVADLRKRTLSRMFWLGWKARLGRFFGL